MRLYFRAASVAHVSPAFDADWDTTTSATRNMLSRAAKSSDTIAFGTQRTWTAGDLRLDRQYVSRPMAAGVVFDSTTVTCYIRSTESNADDNASSRMGVRVVSEDGATERVVLLAVGNYGSSSEFTTGVATNREFATAEALGNYTTEHGDRLVVEIGFADAAGTSPAATNQYGSSAASDLAENETGTAALNPWVVFSAALDFDTPGIKTIEAAAATAVVPVLWTPRLWGR